MSNHPVSPPFLHDVTDLIQTDTKPQVKGETVQYLADKTGLQ